jgi:hypothetical protein
MAIFRDHSDGIVENRAGAATRLRMLVDAIEEPNKTILETVRELSAILALLRAPAPFLSVSGCPEFIMRASFDAAANSW